MLDEELIEVADKPRGLVGILPISKRTALARKAREGLGFAGKPGTNGSVVVVAYLEAAYRKGLALLQGRLRPLFS